ncbi:hypothetical protein, partial [Thiolapillus sp.]|uniref:hypothetical protein n=1 Tax=Thiolapillus sp. TaxID=2017437 RepID=UPI003AF786FE
VRRPTLFSLWRKARRENSAASRLLGSTSLRFALHGWQRRKSRPLRSTWIPQHIPGLVRGTDRFSKRTGGVRFGSCASKQGGGSLSAK